MDLAFLLVVVALSVFIYSMQSEGFTRKAWCQTESPLWTKIGMAVSNNNQYDNDQYILEELPLGNDKFMYKITYTYGTVPPVWYLKGNHKATNGQIRQGYNKGLKSMLPASIPGIMRQSLPEFKLIIPPTLEPFANYCGDSQKRSKFNWKRVGLAAPDYNHFRKDLYVLWEQNVAPGYYKYKVSEIYSGMPLTWVLRGTEKAKNGEFRKAEHRSRSNNFLTFKLNLKETEVEGFDVSGPTPYPGRGKNPWTQLSSQGYKGTSWDGDQNVPPPTGPIGPQGWETVGRAGMYLSTGREVYYNYVLQERKLPDNKYEYRVYNPDNVDFAGVQNGGPEYIKLGGTNKVRNLDIRQALTSSLSLELPGFYRLKTRDY